MPTVFNAANEKAVELFLKGKIKFLEIYEIIEQCMSDHKLIDVPTLEEILETEQWVYESISKKYSNS